MKAKAICIIIKTNTLTKSQMNVWIGYEQFCTLICNDFSFHHQLHLLQEFIKCNTLSFYNHPSTTQWDSCWYKWGFKKHFELWLHTCIIPPHNEYNTLKGVAHYSEVHFSRYFTVFCPLLLLSLRLWNEII